MPNDAFWERNLLNEQQRAQADAQARNDSGTESDDNLPIASTLGTNTKEKIVPHAAGLDGAMPRPKGLKKKNSHTRDGNTYPLFRTKKSPPSIGTPSPLL
jgi:hypothetical protein